MITYLGINIPLQPHVLTGLSQYYVCTEKVK